jgi:hypothetical protein
MNDLEAAQQVRDGVLPSPTQFGNAWLFAIRISGSGSAVREAHGETTYRPPEVWTSPEMLARAAGLPVLLGHPESGLLTSDEYGARTIGAVTLPYARDGELWGVCRILDSDGAHAMMSRQFSTSPGVALGKSGGAKVEGSAGTLLIESDPALLDHVAIVPNDLTTGAGGGVWDKGGAAAGIRNDSTQKDMTMADENNDTAKTDDVGTKLDKLTEGMGAIADMCKSLGTRMDAIEKTRDDGAEPHTSGPGALDDDAAAEQVAMDQAGAGKEAADRAHEAALADAQERADSVAQMFGQRAPMPMMSEQIRAYRVRMAQRFQRYCNDYKDVDLRNIPQANLFDTVEAKIYADAAKAGITQADVPVGQLREVTRVDPHTGVRTTTFYGNGTTFIAALKRPGARVTAFLTNQGS